MPASPDLAGLMDRVCAYLAEAPARDLPAHVVERSKHHLLDTIAAMVSGSRLKPGQRAIAWVSDQGGTPQAGVIGTSIVTSVVNAAIANGMFGHADETDDANFEALIHPGCSIVPTALALGEHHQASGSLLLRSIVVGYDIAARMTRALGLEDFRKHGFSTHSIGATFGCAAAAGALLGLTAGQSRFLLSYAAQQASGVACWAQDLEHIEKAFHFGGMPARAGVTAGTMVAMGFTAVDDVFAADRGFFQAFDRFARPELLVADLGERYEVMNTSIKRWPVGYPVQAPLQGVATLLDEAGLAPSDVEAVRIEIGSGGLHSVRGGSMSNIDLRHLVAVLILDGDVTFESAHDDGRTRDPHVAALRERVTVSGRDDLAAERITRAFVEIDTSTLGTLRHETEPVLGTPDNPMERQDVAEKCRPLIAPILGSARAEELIETVWTLDLLDDVSRLRPLLSA